MSRSPLRAIEKLFDLPNARVLDCAKNYRRAARRAAIMDWRIGTGVNPSAPGGTEVPAHAARLGRPASFKTTRNSWTVIQECYKFVIVWAGVPWDA
jgi:hypothetical protein